MLAEDVDPVLQFPSGLLVPDQIWELSAESVIILAVLVDPPLLVTLPSQVADELVLGLVETATDTLSEEAHRVELLHPLRVVLCKVVFPLGQLLLVRDFLDTLEELRTTPIALRRSTH